jgi:hypothetical protein
MNLELLGKLHNGSIALDGSETLSRFPRPLLSREIVDDSRAS